MNQPPHVDKLPRRPPGVLERWRVEQRFVRRSFEEVGACNAVVKALGVMLEIGGVIGVKDVFADDVEVAWRGINQ